MKPTSFCNYRPMLRFFKSAPFRRFRFREEKVHFRAKLPPTVLRFTARFYGQKSSVFSRFQLGLLCCLPIDPCKNFVLGRQFSFSDM